MKNVFNIKSNYNFLESLVHFVLEKYGSDLLYLSKITILLPSRRSCRVIKEIFLKQAGRNSIILPNIKAIGDVDYDEIGLNFLELDDLEGFNELISRPVRSLKYRCLLIDEIRKFNDKTHLFGKTVNTNQIDLIASNLEDFLSEVEREELNLDDLDNIDDNELAGHKQKILQFLRYFGSDWRRVLEKNDIKSILTYQREMIDLSSKYLEQKKPEFPIIVAGSTGSVKATLRFLKTVSELENGFIFLCGLDKEISKEALDISSQGHPQFMLKRLLETLEVNIEDVKDVEFKQFEQSDKQVNKLISYSFLPASKTDIWTKINDLDFNSIKNLTQIECKNNFDEASIIALIMLQTLQDEGKNAALITSDSGLAMMVKEILLRWDINIDNSKNNKLVDSDIVNYLMSLAILIQDDFKVSNLLTVLKNNITRIGFEEGFHERNLKLFELEILRKNFSLRDLNAISLKIELYGDEDLCKWFTRFREVLDIFDNVKSEDSFLNIILKNVSCAKKLSENYQNKVILDELTGSDEFEEFVEELRLQSPNFKVESEVYHKLLRQFLSGYNFEKKQNHHPRLHILSPIEARLMNYDVMIVANLNENEFIAQAKTQNWLSQKMRVDFGLPDLTRRIGVSALDLSNYLGNKKVFLTRSLTKDNAPTSKLRFLLKLETILKAVKIEDEFDKGQYWKYLLDEGGNFDKPTAKKDDFANPPLSDRLKKVSVTDIAKWIRDPYYIYAKRILKLKPLNRIDEEASFANFGNFVHEVLENFVKDYKDIKEGGHLETLLSSYGKEYFSKYFVSEESHLLWWPRFKNIANWFVKNEFEIRANLQSVDTELSGKMKIKDVEITTKIDRINFSLDGDIEIIDYKTGLVSSNLDVKKGLEPQLPIESLIFLNNKGLNFEDVKKLQYYSLKGRDKNKIHNLGNVGELLNAADEGLRDLIDIFNKSQTPFYPCPNPDIYKENEYHHLARIDEL
jgi:ATP-dependent helicase/nuclease subunit B